MWMIWKRWDVHRMDGVEWYDCKWHRETNAGMKNIDIPIGSQSAVLQQFTYNWSQGACLQPAHKANFYNILHTIHTDIRSFVSFLFFYSIYTGVAGSPLLLHYNFCSLSFAFGNVCQQRELPLFDAAVVVNAITFFCFREGVPLQLPSQACQRVEGSAGGVTPCSSLSVRLR